MDSVSFVERAVVDDIEPSTHCVRGELMDNFGILIQGILGAIAFSTLMLKRLREPRKQRRPWTIWFFDTSKQGLGTLFIHFANVFLADALSADDPCTWYLISFILDSTVGLLLIYLGLKFIKYIVRSFNCTSLYFGEYGDPPKCSAWIGQCALYLIVMVIEKVLVGLMVMPSFWQEVRKYMLSWIKDPHVEVILVMLVIPFLVNTIMFWVIDNFLMRKTKRFYGSSVSDIHKTLTLGSKGSDKDINVSYSIAMRSDSFDSGEEFGTKRGGSRNSAVRYHKLSSTSVKDGKNSGDSYLDTRENDETLLLLQEETEIPRGSSIKDVLSNGNPSYSQENSLDSDNSDNAIKKYTLLTNSVKRL
uniref:store-operated calcium entry regulator STIMATE-like n=1 Tax=Styela clava TaxID=7725 RepID=UPI00193AB55C|nr:store-operated calcium entry regulator STIMATE-like [Styela clava]